MIGQKRYKVIPLTVFYILIVLGQTYRIISCRYSVIIIY